MKIIIIIIAIVFASCQKTELIPVNSFLTVKIDNKTYSIKDAEINKLGFGYTSFDFRNDTLLGTLNIPTLNVKDSTYHVNGSLSVPCIKYEIRNATIIFTSVKNSLATGTFYSEIIKQKSVSVVSGVFENIIIKLN